MIMGALAIKIARTGAGTLFRMPPKRGEGARAARSLHVTVVVTSLSRPLAISRTSLSLRSPELERERYREGNEGERERLPRRFPPRSLSVERERGGPA